MWLEVPQNMTPVLCVPLSTGANTPCAVHLLALQRIQRSHSAASVEGLKKKKKMCTVSLKILLILKYALLMIRKEVN